MQPARLMDILFWFLFVLTLAVCAGLYASAGSANEVLLRPWCPLMLGLTLVCGAQRGIYNGRIRMQYLRFERADSPAGFWLIAIGYLAFGGWLIAVALRMLVRG